MISPDQHRKLKGELDKQAVVIAYMQCALWSSTDDDGEPLDGLYETWEIADEAQTSMIEDCEDFVSLVEDRFPDWRSFWTPERLGHDFWLTRNSHGAGFWDRYPDNGGEAGELGQALTRLCRPYGSSDLYVGDDGKLYVS